MNNVRVTPQERAEMVERQAAQAQQVANLAFARLAQEGLIAEDIAAEHPTSFPIVEPGKVYVAGELVQIDGELKKFVPAAGKKDASWDAVKKKEIETDLPIIELPGGKEL